MPNPYEQWRLSEAQANAHNRLNQLDYVKSIQRTYHELAADNTGVHIST